ncbi:hypothetical protein [Xanthocytophaga agilis]|uniref:Uncharacterized protein n=1 Tax=Xanthocytophaga agilis TaxID=3048010 RepID=A0AAE3R9U9_9BACT|nr:hypothetical protein [Xanthocytophaga agilis]MDJ1505895.1 hypothetical protein [Xanthocytophaga agilis]
MAKKKKKKNKNSLWKSIKPFAKNNKALLSILGAVGVGAALASVIGTEKVNQWIEQASDALNRQNTPLSNGHVSKVKPSMG